MANPREEGCVRTPVLPRKLASYLIAGGCVAALCEEPAKSQEISGVTQSKDIIVTAQRRPELSQHVPISLTAKSGEQIERMQATEMRALDKIVPSLNMTRTGIFTQPYIRGVGKRSTLGVENGVATYVDGVYLASSISALVDLRGVERVEILNGPQGTLFGRNATGGVIQIVTRDPEPGASGEAELQAGSYEYGRGDLYLTGGSDRLAGNFAMSLSHNGGYGTNIFTGKKDQGQVDHSFAGRSKWVWRPTSMLKITFAGDYQNIDQDFSYRTIAGYPSIGRPRVQNFRDGDQDSSNRYRFSYGGVSARADADLGGVTLMSLSALRSLNSQFNVDSDRGPQPLLSASPIVEQNQFSQELQLQSRDERRLKWVAGLYYIRIDERYDPTNFIYGGSYSARLGGRLSQTLFSRGTASSYAAYAQGTLAVGGSTRLTLGGRYTIEQRSVRANGEQVYDNPPFVRPIPGLPLLTAEPFRSSTTFRKLTWRASLDRDLSDRIMGYLSASRGFQSGGWNLQTPQNQAFGPETLDAFEAGLKFADSSHGLNADANVFYYDYSNIQVSAITPIGASTANAASARAYGLELQLAAQLGRESDVAAGVQWLVTRYNDFPNAQCTNFDPDAADPLLPISCDATGNRFPYAPKLKFNIGADRHISLGKTGALTVSGNVAYNSGYFAEADNVVRQKAFATLDLSAEWRPARPGLSMRFWITNLTDTHYFASVATMPTVGVFQVPAPPRRFGASISSIF
jgi:outer membrane receptor protein involved in Fe transport